MSTVENPYAFPGGGPIPDSPQQGYIYDYVGMTLRDYFAAKAMQAVLELRPTEEDPLVIAEAAYDMADAMLKTRES